jgi:hypothetical protein
MNDVQNKNLQNGLRRRRRYCGRLVGCVGLFLVFVVDCRGSRIDYLWRSKDKGQAWDKSLICTVEGFDVKKQGFPWHAETAELGPSKIT